MLHLLDEALENFLRAAVPLPAHEYAVSFDAPDKQWAAGRAASTPTVNAYLREVRPNTSMREAGLQPHVQPDGVGTLRRPLPLVDCRYLLTVWAEDVGNEHQTLGQVLLALLENPVLTSNHLPPPMQHLDPLPRLVLRSGTSGEDSDFWSALGGQLKPGLDLVLTAPIEAVIAQPAARRVERFVMRTGATRPVDEDDDEDDDRRPPLDQVTERDVPPPRRAERRGSHEPTDAPGEPPDGASGRG